MHVTTSKQPVCVCVCVCVCVRAHVCLIVSGIRKAAYYWMESLWGFRGRRTSIRRLAKHYQLIRPVITPAVRKRSKLTPVWKQSDNANTATKPPRVCMYIRKRVYGWVSARMCVCGRRPPCADCGCANCQTGVGGWERREHIWREFIV